MDEVLLMCRVAAGDAEAVSLLVELHYDPIYRLLRHVSGSREDAQDLAQDVFLIARTKGTAFRGTSSLRSWLTRVALNEFFRLRRRERLRALWPGHVAAKVSAVDEAVDSEWLLAGLRRLSVEHRIALLLYEVHEFTVSEVAQITRTPVGTVKARLHYARKRLRQILVCPEVER